MAKTAAEMREEISREVYGEGKEPKGEAQYEKPELEADSDTSFEADDSQETSAPREVKQRNKYEPEGIEPKDEVGKPKKKASDATKYTHAADNDDDDDDELPDPEPIDAAPVQSQAAGNKLEVDGLKDLVQELRNQKTQNASRQADALEETLGDGGIGSLSREEVDGIISRVHAEMEKNTNDILAKSQNMLSAREMAVNTQRVADMLDDKFPKVKPYLNSKQYQNFMMSDVGDGFTVGVSFGERLNAAMQQGDGRTASGILQKFMDSLRNKPPRRVEPRATTAARGVKGGVAAAKDKRAPVNVSEELAKLVQIAGRLSPSELRTRRQAILAAAASD